MVAEEHVGQIERIGLRLRAAHGIDSRIDVDFDFLILDFVTVEGLDAFSDRELRRQLNRVPEILARTFEGVLAKIRLHLIQAFAIPRADRAIVIEKRDRFPQRPVRNGSLPFFLKDTKRRPKRAALGRLFLWASCVPFPFSESER
jgi:hypothetical protein